MCLISSHYVFFLMPSNVCLSCSKSQHCCWIRGKSWTYFYFLLFLQCSFVTAVSPFWHNVFLTCLHYAHTSLSWPDPSCFCGASEAPSLNCTCFLVVCQVFKACNVVYRWSNFCLLWICNITNPCNAGSAFTVYLIYVIGSKERKLFGSICKMIDMFCFFGFFFLKP